MSGLDRAILAEKASAIERHLARWRIVCRPVRSSSSRRPDASDAVILHLWQAVQATIDLALAACLLLHLGTPNSYAEAFERLTQGGYLDPGLAERLTLAAASRNVVAHMYDRIDMNRVYRAAQEGPADLRAFLARLRDLLV